MFELTNTKDQSRMSRTMKKGSSTLRARIEKLEAALAAKEEA